MGYCECMLFATFCLPADIRANFCSDDFLPLLGMALGFVTTDVVVTVSSFYVCVYGTSLDVVLGSFDRVLLAFGN